MNVDTTNTPADRVRRIVARILGADPAQIDDLSRDDSTEWTSVNHIEIVFAIEDEFGITFGEDQLGQIEGVRSLIELVEAAS